MSLLESDGLSVTLPRRVAWPLTAFVCPLVFPWLFPVTLPINLAIWWFRGKVKPFFVSMMFGLVAGSIRVAVDGGLFLRARRLRHLNLASEPVGTRLDIATDDQFGIFRIYILDIVPIGATVLLGCVAAVLFHRLARPRASKPFARPRAVSPLPRFTRVPLAVATTIAVFALAAKPTLPQSVMDSDEVLLRNVDDLIRHPDLFPDRRATRELPAARKLAGPCTELATFLGQQPESYTAPPSVNTTELAELCTHAAIARVNGFDDERAPKVFADAACFYSYTHLARRLPEQGASELRGFCKEYER